MKKIGIITPNGYYNYGNRLQNYALQETIKSLGYEVETLVVECKKPELVVIVPEPPESCLIKRIFDRPITENLKIVFRRIKKTLDKKKVAKKTTLIDDFTKIREKSFLDFSKEYITEKDYSITGEYFPADLIEKFSYYVVGSDQVWNPFYHWGMTPAYWLSFAPKAKRISYAASFGVAEIPCEYHDIYRNYLCGMQSISVREEQAGSIVEELTGRDDVNVNVDPVLLISKDKWKAMAKKHSGKPSGKYILTYYLGKLPELIEKSIVATAKSMDCEIIHLASVDDLNRFAAGPSEFLDYINDAEIFYTDSFHGCAFSILFQTCFVVCPREGSDTNQSMISRIETLLSMFELNERYFIETKSIGEVLKIDFSGVDLVLDREREKSLKYLKRVLV